MGIAGLVDLKKRIKSIQNTKKLTKAMSLVATSKLKKTRECLKKNDMYFASYNEVMIDVRNLISKDSIYVNNEKASSEKLIVVITSDLGMCGSYNFNLVSKVEDITRDNVHGFKLLVVGEKGKKLFERYKFDILDFQGKISDIPTIEEANNIFEYSFKLFQNKLVDEVILVYTWFKNPLVKEPIYKSIFPFQVNRENENNEENFEIAGNENELIEGLMPSYYNSMIYNALINAKTAEQVYRMETMNSASQNAGDLIKALEVKYNRIRQSAITQEISEIIGGSEAQG